MTPAAETRPPTRTLARPTRSVAAPSARARPRSHFTALGWLVLAEAAILASTTLWQPSPLGAALALALVVALIISGWMAQRALAPIAGRWLLPPTPHAGEEVTLGAQLSAARGAPPLTLEAWHPSSRRRELAARLRGLEAQPTRASWTARFRVRGVTLLPPLVVRTVQPFGLIIAERSVGDAEEVLVYPALGRVRRDLRTRLNQWLESRATAPESGDDELARLRDYRPGDHPHRIHWKASARHRSLLVAERHAPGCRRLALVVDTNAVLDGRRFERLIALAATLVDHFLQQGWALTLHGAFCSSAETPSAGMAGDRARLMEALALAGATTTPVQEFIPNGRTTVVLSISAFTPEESWPRPLVLTLAECEQLVWLPRRLRG